MWLIQSMLINSLSFLYRNRSAFVVLILVIFIGFSIANLYKTKVELKPNSINNLQNQSLPKIKQNRHFEYFLLVGNHTNFK